MDKIHEPLDITSGLLDKSQHTQRAYIRLACLFLHDALKIEKPTLSAIPTALLLEPEIKLHLKLKTWLNDRKLQGAGGQSLGQARAAVVWMIKQMANAYPEEFGLVENLVKRERPPKAEIGQRPGTWLTKEQINTIFRELEKMSKRRPARAARDRGILAVGVICGLRRDEIASACWVDLHRQGEFAVLTVHGKGDKARLVKIPPAVEQLLESWREFQLPNTEYIFTRILRGDHVTISQLTGQAVYDVIQGAARASGLEKLAAHDLRRSFARQAHENGATNEQIRQSMGHEQISTTEHYINAVMQFDHTAGDVVAAALAKAKKQTSPTSLPPLDAAALLTRAQAAERLGISLSQFDRLRKQHRLQRIRDLNDDPVTNASTRPYNLYRAGDVDSLFADALRLQKR